MGAWRLPTRSKRSPAAGERRAPVALPAFWALALAVALASCGGEPAPPTPESSPRPNIVLIVADDVGYGDLGVYGSQLVPTPHLDALAREGIRFTQGYVSAPACAVSRAALLTGRDHNRYGYRDPRTLFHERVGRSQGLSTAETLLPELLRDAGYATGAFGKWHLGSNRPFHPLSRGFDTFFGFLSGAHDYFDWGVSVWGGVVRGWELATENEYLTDAITREAVAFIEGHGGIEPFFAYVAYNAIHSPFQAPEDRLAAHAHIPGDARVLAAMLAAMDDGIGRILDALRRLGLAEETLVIFLSDNGGAFTSNGPLRGTKATLFEGGIRVPFLVSWPGTLPAGAVYEHPVSSLDLFPTVLGAAGVDSAPGRPLDGTDLLPHLRGERPEAPHDALFWRWRDQWAVRAGSVKLVRAAEPDMSLAGLANWKPEDLSTALFDLSTDVAEARDLSAARPELARRLRRRLQSWETAVRRDEAR